MNVRIVLSILLIYLGLLTVECRKCLKFVTNSLISRYAYVECPENKPKCCGPKQSNTCATSCLDLKCEKNLDCDGLTCCSGKCSHTDNCLSVTTWAAVGIAIVNVFILLALFRACKWWRKRKARTQESTRTTNEEPAYNEPPFVVSDFENHGFIAPMAPPAYESVVRNTGHGTDGEPPLYNLNLQTIINNSSTNNPGFNNFEVNISIRGSAVFSDDFPPPYDEITNSGDDGVDSDNGQSPTNSSIQEGTVNFERRTLTHSYSGEPPPYSLNEESTTEDSRNNTTIEESPTNSTTSQENTETQQDLDEDSSLGDNIASPGELHRISSSIPEIRNERNSHNGSNIHDNSLSSLGPAGETSPEEPLSYINENEDDAPSDVLNNSWQIDNMVTTHF